MNPLRVTPEFLFANPLPTHEAGGDKQLRGRVLVIGGSVEVPGAALLAGLGALRAGAGVLQIATCRTSAPHLAMAMPEAMVIGCDETSSGALDPSAAHRLTELALNADAILIGPGMTDEGATRDLMLALLNNIDTATLVLDATAFTCLRQQPDALHHHAGRVIATPHAGEMAKFLDISRDAVESDPIAAAHKAARITHGVVALKGATTHIAEGDTIWLSDHGCIGLGTSGSGDTLAGILTGLSARGAPPSLATIWAVYLHAEAGKRLSARIGDLGFLAREIPSEIPRTMADFAAGRTRRA
jgi:ADP-dependent NAD(P)H-hydrate dehydratase